jgi:hypothetical protein
MQKLLIGSILLTAFAVPAVADDFYIVQDSTTRRCHIVEQRPTTTTTTIVGDDTYTTRVEAETAMKTVKVCEDGTTGSSDTTTTIRR